MRKLSEEGRLVRGDETSDASAPAIAKLAPSPSMEARQYTPARAPKRSPAAAALRPDEPQLIDKTAARAPAPTAAGLLTASANAQ